jgi:hypothetical protein
VFSASSSLLIRYPDRTKKRVTPTMPPYRNHEQDRYAPNTVEP